MFEVIDESSRRESVPGVARPPGTTLAPMPGWPWPKKGGKKKGISLDVAELYWGICQVYSTGPQVLEVILPRHQETGYLNNIAQHPPRYVLFFYFLFRPFPSCCFLSHLMRIECGARSAVRPGPRANRDDFAANRLGHMPAARHSKQYIKDKAGQRLFGSGQEDEDRTMYSI